MFCPTAAPCDSTTSLGETVYDYRLPGVETTQLRKVTTDGTETATYEYNFKGRQSSVTKNGATYTYQYNVGGVRVSSTDGSITTTYVVDPANPTGYAQVLNERTGSDLLSYTIGHDVISQHDAKFPADCQSLDSQENDTADYLLYDGHGSTRALLRWNDPSLSIQTYDYDAYGNPIGFDQTTAGTNLLYFGIRKTVLTGDLPDVLWASTIQGVSSVALEALVEHALEKRPATRNERIRTFLSSFSDGAFSAAYLGSFPAGATAASSSAARDFLGWLGPNPKRLEAIVRDALISAAMAEISTRVVKAAVGEQFATINSILDTSEIEEIVTTVVGTLLDVGAGGVVSLLAEIVPGD